MSTALLQTWFVTGVITIRAGRSVSAKLAVNTRFDAMTKSKVALLVTMPFASVQLTKPKPGLAVAVME